MIVNVLRSNLRNKSGRQNIVKYLIKFKCNRISHISTKLQFFKKCLNRIRIKYHSNIHINNFILLATIILFLISYCNCETIVYKNVSRINLNNYKTNIIGNKYFNKTCNTTNINDNINRNSTVYIKNIYNITKDEIQSTIKYDSNYNCKNVYSTNLKKFIEDANFGLQQNVSHTPFVNVQNTKSVFKRRFKNSQNLSHLRKLSQENSNYISLHRNIYNISNKNLTFSANEILFTKKFNSSDRNAVQKLIQIIMQGLGLKRLPDAVKANINQKEFEKKHIQYLTRIRERKKIEIMEQNQIDSLENYRFPKLFHSISYNSSHFIKERKKRSLDNKISNTNIVFITFPISEDEYESSDDIEEAILRIAISNSKEQQSYQFIATHEESSQHIWKHRNKNSSHELSKHFLNIKVYQLTTPHGKLWLNSKHIEVNPLQNFNRWIEFDLTEAVGRWISGEQENLGLQIQCDKCSYYGVKIIENSNEINNSSFGRNLDSKGEPVEFNPVLNIIGRAAGVRREKRSHKYINSNSKPQLTLSNGRKKRKTDCYEGNTRCCRHAMEVVFKEIKDFSFIIQPKIFDAGFCRGRCPPRYNPAHHHAVLQSLIWKQDRSKAPRPCCAPSKLVELEVLHIDENDSTKLKVSRWNDMKVTECACS